MEDGTNFCGLLRISELYQHSLKWNRVRYDTLFGMLELFRSELQTASEFLNNYDKAIWPLQSEFLEQMASANIHNIPFFLFLMSAITRLECLLSQSGLFSIQNASLNIVIYVHQFHSSMTVSLFVSWIWIGCFWRQIWWLMALQLNTVWEFGQLDFKRIFRIF